MKKAETNRGARRTFARRLGIGLVAVLLAMVCIGTLIAAAPPAGTTIGNQASATYKDGSGQTVSVTSNQVNTTVQQVYSATLTADNSYFAVSPSTVTMSHVLTNTGNGNDTFTLSATAVAAGVQFQLTNLQAFADQNGDGIADNATNLLTGGNTITVPYAGNPGNQPSTFRFVVIGTIPAGRSGNDIAKVTVAASDGSGVSLSNTDTVNVTTYANEVLTKTFMDAAALNSVSGGPANGTTQYTVKLQYQNTGLTAASTIDISDIIPAAFQYVAGSAKWNNVALPDNSGVAFNTITPVNVNGSVTVQYQYDTTNKKVRALVSSQAPGSSAAIYFKVTVPASTAAQSVVNTMTATYLDGQGGATPPTITATPASANFNVLQTSNVSGVGATIGSAVQGATIYFQNVFTNNGNFTDTFNVTFNQGTIPGTVTLLQSDKATPLSGSPAQIQIAAGGSYTIWAKVVLPANFTSASAMSMTKTLTSTLTGGSTVTVTDTLSSITAATVDITNNSTSGPGVGAGPGATADATQTINPATSLSTTFTLYVNNKSTQVVDSFNMYVATAAGLPSGNSVPAGWTVEFYKPSGASCANVTTTGTKTSNTGSIDGGAASPYQIMCAVVTVPSTEAPGTKSLYFYSVGSNTGIYDGLRDDVTVSTYHRVVIQTPGTNSVQQGQSTTYQHTVVNQGNVDEMVAITVANVVNPVTLSWPNSLVVLYDSDGVTPLPASFSLTAGSTATIFVKVTVPGNAASGNALTSSVGGTYNGATVIAPVTDVTTVLAGDIQVYKWQAADANCDGVEDGVASINSYGRSALSMAPGSCLIYMVQVVNRGTAAVTNLDITDGVPSYTKYWKYAGVSPTPSFKACSQQAPDPTLPDGSASGAALTATVVRSGSTCYYTTQTGYTLPVLIEPADNTAGNIKLPVVSMQAGDSIILVFSVKIDQ